MKKISNSHSISPTLIFLVFWFHIAAIFFVIRSNQFFVWKEKPPLIVKQVFQSKEILPQKTLAVSTKKKEKISPPIVAHNETPVKKKSVKPKEEKPAPSAKKTPIPTKNPSKKLTLKKVSPEKVLPKTSTKEKFAPKASLLPQEKILEELQAAKTLFANLEKKSPEKPSPAEKTLPLIPEKISLNVLNIQTTSENSSENPLFCEYQRRLIEDLKSQLNLPDYGEVKVHLTINEEGKITDLDILSSESLKNKLYLKKNLGEISFPWWSQNFSQKNAQSFTITFRNE